MARALPQLQRENAFLQTMHDEVDTLLALPGDEDSLEQTGC